MKIILSGVLGLLMFAANSAALAVTGSRGDASDPKAAVPPLRYESPLRDYRPLGEQNRVQWKAANDQVGRIGGWRAYAKEAAEAGAQSTTPTPPVTAPSGPPASTISAPKAPAPAKSATRASDHSHHAPGK